MRILAVEDEIKIARLIKKGLEMSGFFVDLAHDGQDGLIKARKGGYDLFILDLMLPKIGGLEICRTLRKEKIKTPIIMLTARDTVGDKIEGMEAGAEDYMTKPFSLSELASRIEALVGYSRKGDKELGDIDQQYAEDDEANKMSELNKKILDNAPISIISIDRGGYITSANKYFKRFSKTKSYRNVNIFASEFFIREGLVDDYRKLLAEGVVVRRENCYEKNNKGEDKYLKIIAVPLRDAEGNIEGALSMALDNTEAVKFKNELEELNKELEKRIEQRTAELDRANAELAKVLEFKSVFMADVSHEMRTSLAVMQCNLELASLSMSLDSETLESYEQIFNEIRRMSGMLSDLSLLSHSDSSERDLSYKNIDLNEIIDSVCKSLKAVADEKNITMNCGKNSGKIELVADGDKIEKMLMNLVKNAIRYNNQGGWVNVEVEEFPDNIILKVEDGGIGIAPEHLPYIFERFYRADKAKSREGGGSGLGLAICKWVAQSHGGTIEVDSEVGKGSLFTVKLPRESKMKMTRGAGSGV